MMAALTLQEEGIFREKVKQYLVLFDRACTPPPPSSLGWGRGVKNFRKVFACRGGGVINFYFGGVGGGGNFVGRRSRNFEIKIKTA